MQLVTLTLNWTDEELHDAITGVLANITGLDPNKGEIRIAYSQQGQPSWRHMDTVVSYYLNPVNDIYDQDITDFLEYDDEKDLIVKTEKFTQVLECRCSCYGPESRMLSTLIRAGIQSDENRLSLSRVGIYPVPKVPPPIFMPYEYNKQWWLRSDVVITLNVFSTITSTVNRIVSVEATVNNEKQTGEIHVNTSS